MQKITFGVCDSQPNKTYFSNGKIQYLVNIESVIFFDTTIEKSRIIWQYNYVEIEDSVYRDKIILVLAENNITTIDIITGE